MNGGGVSGVGNDDDDDVVNGGGVSLMSML